MVSASSASASEISRVKRLAKVVVISLATRSRSFERAQPATVAGFIAEAINEQRRH